MERKDHELAAWDATLSGDTEVAIAEFRAALEQAPGDGSLHYGLAGVLLKTEQWRPCEQELRSAAQLNERIAADPKAHYMLGLTLYHLGEPRDAIAEFRRAIELDARYAEWPPLRYHLGLATADAGTGAAALAEIEEYVRVHPDEGEAHAGLARVYWRRGMFRQALPEYERAHEMNEGDPASLVGIALCYSNLGRMDEAIKTLERVAAGNADYSPGLANLGALYTQRAARRKDLDLWRQARSVLAKAVALDPADWRTWMELAVAESVLGDESAAAEASARALEASPPGVGPYARLAGMFLRVGRVRQSWRAFIAARASTR